MAVRKAKVEAVLKILDDTYGKEMQRYLNYETPWQLLIAVILSAQCTDARVNMVTKVLFEHYPTAADLGSAKLSDVEKIIKSTGFFRAKAKNIIAASQEIDRKYGGDVPATIEELTALPGVGRKTANVIRGNIYNEPSIVVDTHVKRISKKLGFTKNDDPTKVEFDLMKVLPQDHWILYNIQVIAHGRSICHARSPKCGECPLIDLCPTKK